jgi:flotillin
MLAKAYRRVVEPNEVHIVQSSGKTTIYGKQPTTVDGEEDNVVKVSNSYFEWPAWWPVIGVQSIVLPLSNFELKLTNYDAYDIGKVPFVVDIVAFFRIDDAAIAAKRVSSLQELHAQLTAILQCAVRTILAQHEIEQIMEDRSTYGEAFTKEVGTQLRAWGVVNVKSIELMDIRDGADSETISNIMAKKESLIEMQSRVEVAKNRRDAETAEIEAAQVVDVRKEEAAQLVGERTAEKEKMVGIADEKAKQEIKLQAKETATRDMAVQQVEHVRAAEINREVQVVKADEDRQTFVIRAEGDKQKEIITAEGEKQQTVLVAEGNLVESLKSAEGILAVGTSEAEAKRLGEMATVSPQLELADGIGENLEYQEYMVRIENVNKDRDVGVANAKALQDAGIKMIINAGDAPSGMNNILDVLTTKGGTNIAGMVEAINQTDEGSALLTRLGINGDKDAATASKATPTVTPRPRKASKKAKKS